MNENQGVPDIYVLRNPRAMTKNGQKYNTTIVTEIPVRKLGLSAQGNAIRCLFPSGQERWVPQRLLKGER